MQKIILLLSLSATMFLSACGGKCCDGKTCTDPKCEHYKGGAAAKDSSATKLAAAYDCPMQCKGAASDKAGVCPVCKMDLEATK